VKPFWLYSDIEPALGRADVFLAITRYAAEPEPYRDLLHFPEIEQVLVPMLARRLHQLELPSGIIPRLTNGGLQEERYFLAFTLGRLSAAPTLSRLRKPVPAHFWAQLYKASRNSIVRGSPTATFAKRPWRLPTEAPQFFSTRLRFAPWGSNRRRSISKPSIRSEAGLDEERRRTTRCSGRGPRWQGGAALAADLGVMRTIREETMTVPEAAALLGGFALAHAAWSASDLQQGELVVPLAIVERAGNRELLRFEAATQAEAVEKGKQAMADVTSRSDAWAFAREGLFNRAGGKVDVLVVDLWAKGMSSPATVIQEFEPYAVRAKFRIIGEPQLVVDGRIQTDAAAKDVLARVRAGIKSHPKVVPLWNSWR